MSCRLRTTSLWIRSTLLNCAMLANRLPTLVSRLRSEREASSQMYFANISELRDSLDARLVRTLVSHPGGRLSLEEAENWLRPLLPEFADHGIMLSLENYEAYPCIDLANLVRRLESDHIGICLDTVNSLGALEVPKCVVETLAPLTVNLHIKDFVIERIPAKMGFVVRGAQAGCGLLDIPWILKQMPPDRDLSVILEQWPPLGSSVDAAAALEQEWATGGVEYLRECGCT